MSPGSMPMWVSRNQRTVKMTATLMACEKHQLGAQLLHTASN